MNIQLTQEFGEVLDVLEDIHNSEIIINKPVNSYDRSMFR